MIMKKKLMMTITILVVILSSAILLLPNFLLDNFGECYAENSACCKKLGSSFTCTHVSMACRNKDELPVFKGCDSDCKHIIVCVEKVESEFGDDTEINKSCFADSDCKLPGSYAIRSDCPYDMKCIDYKCTVICPWDELSLTPFFPTQKEPATAHMQALLSDKPEELELVDGCLRVNDGHDNYLIVWPYGFSLSTDEDGVIQIIDETGQPIMHVGDKVRFSGGGGEMSGGDSGDVSAVSEQLPSVHCSGPYWILGDIEEIMSIKNEIHP